MKAISYVTVNAAFLAARHGSSAKAVNLFIGPAFTYADEEVPAPEWATYLRRK